MSDMTWEKKQTDEEEEETEKTFIIPIQIWHVVLKGLYRENVKYYTILVSCFSSQFTRLFTETRFIKILFIYYINLYFVHQLVFIIWCAFIIFFIIFFIAWIYF